MDGLNPRWSKIRASMMMVAGGFFGAGLFLTPVAARASAWMETTLSTLNDNNVFSYVIPYGDNYTQLDFRYNLKDKLSRTTHYSLNYNFRGAVYNRWTTKNYLNHSLNAALEEDLLTSLVGSLSGQGTWYQYPDTTSAKYNYLNFAGNATLRYYLFALQFTSFELGFRYQLYNLPNYNFGTDGWTPSLTFQEEVAEYTGLGATLNLLQALSPALDLEMGGAWSANDCPERPLYAPFAAQSLTLTAADFVSERRRDNFLSANAGITWRFSNNSYVKAGTSWSRTLSNANTLTYDLSLRSRNLQDGYYDLQTQGCLASGVYCFGQENSYLRLNLGFNLLAYSQRHPQDSAGAILSGARADRQYNLLLEFNQRLGEWLGTSWLIRVSYNYIQNLSNDYYYQYNREVFMLGLAGNLFL